MTYHLLEDGPDDPVATLVLAHGAGAPMDSEFMSVMADELAARDLRVIRFEFPYMAERRATGKKRPPQRVEKLLECYGEVVRQIGSPERLILGGKSMGGRVASMVVDDLGARGLCCLGYPFHPPGKPDRLRTEHLQDLKTSTLVVQGERDTFGTAAEVEGYSLSSSIRCVWIPDGDHSLKPRVRSGHTLEGNLKAAADAIATFAHTL